MINAERREPRSKRLDGAMAGGANCEVVEPSGGSGTVWIETQRQRWTTVGVLQATPMQTPSSTNSIIT
jgi:hypothetical protein